MKVPKYIKNFVENYCELNNLIIVKIESSSYEVRSDDGKWKGNIPQWIVNCMNDENKFLQFKVIDKKFNQNGELWSHLKMERC